MPVSGEWERVHQQRRFDVVVPQPMGVCILKKLASCSAWSHLIHHCLMRLMLVKCSFHSTVYSLLSCGSGRLTEMGPWPPVEIFRNLHKEFSGRNMPTDIHVSWNLHLAYVMYDVMYAALTSQSVSQHVWCCRCVFSSLIGTRVLCFKSEFMTLK